MTKTAPPRNSPSPLPSPSPSTSSISTPANVRKSQIDDAGIQDLAADIALRGLLQSLSVRPVLETNGRRDR